MCIQIYMYTAVCAFLCTTIPSKHVRIEEDGGGGSSVPLPSHHKEDPCSRVLSRQNLLVAGQEGVEATPPSSRPSSVDQVEIIHLNHPLHLIAQ